MKHILNVTEAEWIKADTFFKQNPSALKLEKTKDDISSHSFIKVEGEMYAMENGKYLGFGGFSKVKIVQNRDGVNFKVNISGNGHIEDNEIKILRKLNQFKGMMYRNLPGEKPRNFWDKDTKRNPLMTEEKSYKISELHSGDDLFSKLKGLNEVQRLIVAIKCAEAIQDLHQRHSVIHADIKSENFIAKIDGNKIKVRPIDFGYSLELAEGNNRVYYRSRGTSGFAAPEICSHLFARYSFGSDIYALGFMFFNDLLLQESLWKDMVNVNANERMPLDEVIANLVKVLESYPDLDADAQQVIQDSKERLGKNKTEKTTEGEPIATHKMKI